MPCEAVASADPAATADMNPNAQVGSRTRRPSPTWVSLAFSLMACLLTVGALTASGWAAAQPGPETTPDSWPAFPLDQVRPGLVGHGLTQGPGGIERFEVEVLGLQEQTGMGFPLVLVRASGPIIDAGGGVSAGMSGSPVLLPSGGGDALLGAIAYVFSDAPGGLALVTPTEIMRRQAWDGIATGQAPTSLEITSFAQTAPGALGRIVPVATPVLVAGLGDRSLALLQALALDGAVLPVQAVRSGGSGAQDAPLQAGSAIGVRWARGDIEIGAVGTVTEIDGERLLAFGHPVMGWGGVDWPFTAAEVLAVVPHRSAPFKLANVAGGVLGAVRQDRSAAVGGLVGAEADMMPVTLTIVDGDGETTLGFEVVRDARLWPLLVAVATLEAMDRSRSFQGGGTASLQWDIGFRTGPSLRLAEPVVHPTDLGLAAARLAASPLLLLAENPFQDPGLSRLHLLLQLEERRQDIEIRRVLTDPGEIQAGSIVPVYLQLQPYRRPGEVRTVDVQLPPELVGDVELVVRGGQWPRDPDRTVTPDPEDAPLTFDELLAFLRERPGGGDLVIEARDAGGRWYRLERLRLDGVASGRIVHHLRIGEAAGEPATEEGSP